MRVITNVAEWLREFSLHFYERQDSKLNSIRPITDSVDPYPHQFKGRVLFEKDSACGAMLLADEVGVGKTYTVGHVIRWMISERNASRILILCPARLVDSKWVKTMHDFGVLPAKSYSGKSLQRWFTGNNKRNIMISSYEKASGSGISLEEFQSDFAQGKYQDIDLVVIDEIHNFVQSAKNRKGLADIALSITDSRIGLTATPIWNGLNDFDEIVKMLKPEGFEQFEIEKNLLLQGTLSRLSAQLYSNDSDIDYLSTELSKFEEFQHIPIEEKLESENGRMLLAQGLLELSPFSSWLIRTTAREVTGFRERIIHDPILVDLEQESGNEFYNPDTSEIESTPSELEIHRNIRNLLKYPVHKRQLDSLPTAYSMHLEKILNHFDASVKSEIQKLSNYLRDLPQGGSKSKEILRLLEQNLSEEDCLGVVIFTHWHPTFNKLKSQLEAVRNKYDFEFFSADPVLDDEQLDDIVGEFQGYEGPKKPVILVTDKFSEGRDLFNANYMIHIDVPQNPLKVEQRIGRIDRMGQQSNVVHVQYVLINQSSEHHYLEILKRRLDEFSTYFGVANSILPDDVGFDGELDESMVEQIRGNDLDSMSHLTIDDKIMTQLSERYAYEFSDQFRALYSGLVKNLFDNLLTRNGELNHSNLIYNIGKDNWKRFVINFSDNDARLRGQSGTQGVLARRVNRQDKTFIIKLDSYGLPVQYDIRRKCIEHLFRASPEQLPTIRFKSTTFNKGIGYLFKVAFHLDSKEFKRYFAYSLEHGNLDIIPDSEWKNHLLNSDLDEDIRVVDQNETSRIIDDHSPTLITNINKIVTREKHFLEMRRKRLIHVLSTITDTSSHLHKRISNTIEAVENKFNSMQIRNLDINLLGILEGLE